MRKIAALAVLAAAAAAGGWAEEPAPPVRAPAPIRALEGGRLTDSWWSLSFFLEGMMATQDFYAPDRIFAGETADVRVEIVVREAAAPAVAVDARDAAVVDWRLRKRPVRDLKSGGDPSPWVTFVETAPSGFEHAHAHVFRVRGLQTFVVHAWSVGPPSATSAASLTKTAAALELGPARGGNLASLAIARYERIAGDSPALVSKAADAYMRERSQNGLENAAMAETILTHALGTLTELEAKPDDEYLIVERLGLATLMQRRTEAALVWFGRSLQIAALTTRAVQNVATTRYNLACSYSVAGNINAAFAELERVFEKAAPVSVRHLEWDPDLAHLRADPRWKELIAKRTAAEAKR